MSNALLVFAKAPIPGLAKTRLIPRLGSEGAAALAQRMLEHTLVAGASAAYDYAELCVAPEARHPLVERLAKRYGFALTAQGEGSLGERMSRALARALQKRTAAVLIGTDAPSLDAQQLRHAAAALRDNDAVFVPALDGGYALVGLSRFEPDLFTGIPWGTSAVMQTTRERAIALGLHWCELDPVVDIDNPADLVHLPAQWLA